MTKRHGLAISVLACAATIALALTAWYLLAVRLPDPHTASRSGLARWLVLRDISAEPAAVQLALVNRLQSELRLGWEAPAQSNQLSDAYRERLRKNAEHLQRVWFRARVADYAQLPPERRMSFLNDQIDAISRWSAIEMRGADSPAVGSHAPGEAAVQFFGQIESWIEESRGQEREQMIRAVQDGVVCWLATGDLAEQPRGVRLGLAVRIVRELNAGMKLDEILLELTPRERERLLANGELLLEAWLHDQANEFAALPDGERKTYVERQIDDVLKWGVLEVLAVPTTTADSEPTDSAAKPSITHLQAAGMARLAALVTVWLERAEPSERANLQQLISHVQGQLLWRQLRGVP